MQLSLFAILVLMVSPLPNLIHMMNLMLYRNGFLWALSVYIGIVWCSSVNTFCCCWSSISPYKLSNYFVSPLSSSFLSLALIIALFIVPAYVAVYSQNPDPFECSWLQAGIICLLTILSTVCSKETDIYPFKSGCTLKISKGFGSLIILLESCWTFVSWDYFSDHFKPTTSCQKSKAASTGVERLKAM